MTTTDVKVLHTRAGAIERGIRGTHGPLIITEAPAGASALVGTPLLAATLTVDGDYHCLIPIAGLATQLNVHVKPQLDTATLSSDLMECADFDPRSVNVADAEELTAGSSDGALSDDTEQVAELLITGALYARYTLTVASAGSVTFDRAEYVGK